jgi:hypothetical protein
LVRKAGLEPASLAALAPKASVFANFTTSARLNLPGLDQPQTVLLLPPDCLGQSRAARPRSAGDPVRDASTALSFESSGVSLIVPRFASLHQICWQTCADYRPTCNFPALLLSRQARTKPSATELVVLRVDEDKTVLSLRSCAVSAPKAPSAQVE